MTHTPTTPPADDVAMLVDMVMAWSNGIRHKTAHESAMCKKAKELHGRLSQPVMDAGAELGAEYILSAVTDVVDESRAEYLMAALRRQFVLYTPPAQQPESNAGDVVPDGFICVAYPPTKEQIDLGWSLIRGNLRPDEIYPQMLKASPPAPRKTAAQVRREALEEALFTQVENPQYRDDLTTAFFQGVAAKYQAIFDLLKKETP